MKVYGECDVCGDTGFKMYLTRCNNCSNNNQMKTISTILSATEKHFIDCSGFIDKDVEKLRKEFFRKKLAPVIRQQIEEMLDTTGLNKEITNELKK